jgi:cell division septation protein DedD
MEEPVSWKGQTFTLLVFGGIVVLCSIFFVLGMLVGRDQGQRIAQTAAVEADKPIVVSQADPEPLSFFEETTKEKPQLDLLPPPPSVKETPKQPEPPPESPTPQKYFLQIFATKDAKAADRELTKVKSKDFRALILPPSPGEKDPQFRVHVGPYNSIAEADMAKKELQAQGYKDVFRK